MEYMKEEKEEAVVSKAVILCCECATPIEPNPTNMCVACLRMHVDISEGIPKQGTLYFCKFCDRYLQPPNQWITAELESKTLLSVCLKKIKGLNKVRLVDAGFIWTEPHSRRIKVKLIIQKEVQLDAILQQEFVVEFTVTQQMCEECHRVEAQDYWRARCQIRQRTSHMKTMFYLEQLILKYKAHKNTTNIKALKTGMDFYFSGKKDSRKMVEFLQTVVPCRFQEAQELVSQDTKSNVFNYKHTYCVEIVPICRDSVVVLSSKLARSLGNMGQICVCLKVTKMVYLIDPQTTAFVKMNAETYWRHNFQQVCNPKQLKRFIVMEVDAIPEKSQPHIVGGAMKSLKHSLADVWVVPEDELGMEDKQLYCRSHLGNHMYPGDTFEGFSFSNANINNLELVDIKRDKIPDVVLIKKVRGTRNKRIKKRKWKLEHLPNNEALDNEEDYNDFLEELEEDPETRENINIYKDSSKIAVESDPQTDDEDTPQISLQEMLEDLCIGDDATGEEGAAMEG